MNDDLGYNSEENEAISMALSQEDLFALMGMTMPKDGSAAEKPATGVYLAGPIEQDLKKVNPHSLVWRQEAIKLFDARPEVWDIKDPTRNRVNVADDGTLSYKKDETNGFDYNPYYIFSKDLKDLSGCSIYLGNFTEASAGSVGSLFELGYAYSQRIAIILIATPKLKIKNHPFIKESADIIVETVEEAVEACAYLRNEFNEPKSF